MRTMRLVILVLALATAAIFVPTAPTSNGGGEGGGGVLCWQEQQTMQLGNTHWVIESPAGHFNQAAVKVRDLNAPYSSSRWHLERWVITPPSGLSLAWSTGSIFMHNTQFYIYPYATNFYYSPQTSSDVYEQFRLIVDDTNYFTYTFRTWSQNGRCMS
jgi:hypothetical protein